MVCTDVADTGSSVQGWQEMGGESLCCRNTCISHRGGHTSPKHGGHLGSDYHHSRRVLQISRITSWCFTHAHYQGTTSSACL